jgi:superfamily II DNA or RNA helicase
MRASCVVSRCGVEVPKDAGINDLVRAELLVTPFVPNASFPAKPFKVFIETADGCVVPIHWAKKHNLQVVDTRHPGSPMIHPFVGSLKPDLSQPEAVAAVQDSWRATGGAMLCLSTGFGKTTCALYLSCKLGMKTAVVVHKEFLMQQWIERISAHVPTATVSKVQGNVCDTSGDFVIVMLQTLVSRAYPASVFSECGLVVVDEVHHIAAQCFSSAMFSLCAPYMLGLTATPERRDHLDKVIGWFMGDIAFRAERTHQAGTVVRIVRYLCPRFSDPPPMNRRGDVCYSSVITALAENAERTDVVVNEACLLAQQGRDVLVLSHRRSHCGEICTKIVARGVECSTYLGGDKIVPTSRVVVATYALTSEGFDCPRLSALVLATPGSNVEQACGRVMRGSCTASAVVVDIADRWGVCFSMHSKRRGFYKKAGFALEFP